MEVEHIMVLLSKPCIMDINQEIIFLCFFHQNLLKPDSPHTSATLERVRPGLERPSEMGMDLVQTLAALIQETKLKQRPHIRLVAHQSDE